MSGDWLKLHRKAIDSRVFSDAFLWQLWCWCLMRANWKSGWKSGCEILPGQFACGREQAAEQLNCSGSKWYRGMTKLREWGMITIEVNSRFSVVTICQWRTYQDEEGGERTTDEQQVNSKRTTGEQPVNTIEEGEEQKERKKDKKSVRKPAKQFVRPTVLLVEEYCKERSSSIDPQGFIDFYESNGWQVGRNGMKDWKATVRNWERRDSNSTTTSRGGARLLNGAVESLKQGRLRPTNDN